ncbi:GNAT family N-acetyltransferase [Formosa maritima]|uniref:GNAT family N-acetyltransferase n=1 Tax=Formosa maritima TaxID=2592046 RepID=A0A5D0GGA5_9FLAO|nr:GNAT family protein [Formosa maritima]TYA57329.1 GNAT family N-acetyltransferase [Formosa maritima]
MDLQFRKLKANESNLYREIRLESLKKFPKNFGSSYKSESKITSSFFQSYIELQDINNFVIGAFYKDSLIGISGFNRYVAEKTKHRGRIIQVYVKSEFQGQQIGSKIIRKTLREAFKISEIEQIEINVLTTNEKTEILYSKLGFKTYGTQKQYL